MTLNQRLIVPLFLGLTVMSGLVTSLCVLSEDGTRCVCDVLIFRNQHSLNCGLFTELEVRDGTLGFQDLFIINPVFPFQLSQIHTLIFVNVKMPFIFFGAWIPFLAQSKLTEIHLISCTLEAIFTFFRPRIPFDISPIRIIRLEDVVVDPLVLRTSLMAFHDWLLGPLESLSIVHSGLTDVNCYWAQRLENLVYLDLSDNPISYSDLQNITQCSPLTFRKLRSIRLSHSNLDSLQSLCMPLSLTPVLNQLDVSRNRISVLDYPECLHTMPIRMLNLSNVGITKLNSTISASVEELDLSYNFLEEFDGPPSTLKKLRLSHNGLTRLPTLDKPSRLRELMVDGNLLTILINDTDDKSTLHQFNILRAGKNPYHCDCGLYETFAFLHESGRRVSVEDYPKDFLCATPDALRGTPIANLTLRPCGKSTSGMQHPGLPFCLTLFTGLLSQLILFC